MKSCAHIELAIDSVKKGLRLCIEARRANTLFDAKQNAEEHNEARFQLTEGAFYDYEINDENFILGNPGSNIVQPRKRSPNLGRIAPNIFVGTLEIPLLKKENKEQCAAVELEVQSVKADYRSDYRDMLESITEKCTDLLLQAGAPVSHHFDIDYTKDSQTLYQRFAFIKSVIHTDEFTEAVHRIITGPVTEWTEQPESKDVRRVRRFSNANVKELASGSRRTPLPETHHLKKYGVNTLPERIVSSRKTDTADTSENRFIKFALETFLKFCTDINKKAKEYNHKKTQNESAFLIRDLENKLSHAVFKDISRPDTLKLNSPVLQRKEGYREVLRVWLMFDLAAQLVWSGGEDVYGAGKKDMAALYEYWLFFELMDLLQDIFDIAPKDVSDLIKKTDDGLSLQIKQGKVTALQGMYDSGSRKLNVRFNYNRPFGGNSAYPDSGSWTTTLRPDYTLSLWPYGITEAEAETQELIVHVHFDAKYKVASFADYAKAKTEAELNDEKTEERKGNYKNADLLKMHAYKDAIRRTGGAYVLYPGDKSLTQSGFHEIIPGLGAFPVRPSKTDSGTGELKAFIKRVTDHFIKRTSQREKMAYRTFDIHKNKPGNNSEANEPLPEAYLPHRDLIPDKTFVLVGFYHSEKYWWIKDQKLYPFRMNNEKGSLILDKETVNAKYLLLHKRGDKKSGILWKIVSKGPKVYSKEEMLELHYPYPSQQNYLVIEIEAADEPELMNKSWDFRQLDNFNPGRYSSGIPFTASLTELMKCKAE